MLSFLQSFSDFFGDNVELFSFIAAAVVGDPGVILTAFLATSEGISLWLIFLWTMIGTVVADIFWFWLPRTRGYRFLAESRFLKKKHHKLEAKLRALSKNKEIPIMAGSKVLAGTRVVMILALSLYGIRFLRFLWLDTITNVIWMALLIAIGFLAQGSLETALEYFQNTQIALAVFLAGGLLVFYLFKKGVAYIKRKAATRDGCSANEEK